MYMYDPSWIIHGQILNINYGAAHPAEFMSLGASRELTGIRKEVTKKQVKCGICVKKKLGNLGSMLAPQITVCE